ncbi:SLAM family member 9 [Amia ocellicauda]|uniref:SLAM family member 9 n=1 Tax=Amia ocellicauda TaxID=2972642 RepID=UPI0034641808
MAIRLYIFLLLSYPLKNTGAEENIDLYRLEGKSVCLDVKGHDQSAFRKFTWYFNKTNLIVEYTNSNGMFEVIPKYEGKVEFHKTNFSLVISNLHVTDNGIYTAQINDLNGQNIDIITYKLIIQEKTYKPQFNVSYNFSTSDTCNVSVTCSKDQATSVTFICNISQCSEDTVSYTRSPALLMDVYTDGSSIVCNMSNQVSWSNSTVEVKDVCPLTETREKKYAPGDNIVVLSVLIIVIVIIIIIIIIIICKNHHHHCHHHQQQRGTVQENDINTLYASVENTSQRTTSPNSVQTEYAYVGAKQRKHQTDATIYATIQAT